MPFLLMVFLTVACIPSWDKAPGWVQSPALSAALTWLGVALVGAEALWSAWRVRAALRRNPARRERIAARHERTRFWRQFLLMAVYAASIYVCGWGWAVGQFWNTVGVKVLILAPFFVGLLLTWVFAYDADRALYVAALRPLEANALTGSFLDMDQGVAAPAIDPARDFGGRWSYVLFQGRQKLALVFLPVVLLVVQQEISLRISKDMQDRWAVLLTALGVASIFAVLAALPWMIRLSLNLKPLPPGPTRDRLLAAARRLRFRFSDLLLWNTRGGMANAMVIGVLPWPRYVIFTDRFLEEFNGDEIEAVFGHEVGHVKHWHMLFYLAFLMLSVGVAFAADPFLAALTGATGAGASLTALLVGTPTNSAWLLVGAAVLLVYLFAVFGFLSRRCERQADVHGCRAVSCRRPDCAGHDDGPVLAPHAAGLCPTGIRTFIYALEKVAQVNGISRDRPGFLQSWQHGSIARRVAFLYGLLKDPDGEKRFQRRVAWVKWGAVVVLGVVLAVLVAVSPWVPAGPSDHPAGAASQPADQGIDR